MPSSKIFETHKKKPKTCVFYILGTITPIKNYTSNTVNQSNVNSREEENMPISGIPCSIIFLWSIIIFSKEIETYILVCYR